MDSIYEGLRRAIDNQNIHEVKCFINNNPEINYEEVCPDGMSLLWLALMPKKGKNISPELIKFLVSYKKPDKSFLVNPSQTFLNCKPVHYLSLLKEYTILWIIKEAVSNYLPLSERATNQLAAIARAYSTNSKTEHYLLAERFSSNSRIMELSRRYGQEGLVRLYFKDQDFRGYNFSGLNLNDSVFENCHLPFSGVNLQCERVTFENCSLANMDKNITEEEGLRNLGLLLKSEMQFSPLVTQFYLQAITTHKTLMRHSNLLFTAIKKGRLDVLNAILENEHCTPELLEVTKEEGNTLLMEAVQQGETDIAIALLNSKHCTSRLLEKVNAQKANVLMIAVWIGQTEVVKVILNNKYCTPEFLEQRCPNNKPILMVAIERRHSNIAIAILNSKHCSLKLLEQSHDNNLTILMIATSLGQIEVVQAILEHKHCSQAFLEKRCPNKATVLMAAIMSRFTHIAIAIIESKHCRPKFLEELHVHNLNVLIMAASRGQTEVVKALLKKNCTEEFLEQIDSKNNTAESIAQQRKSLDILAVLKEYKERLLANNANIEAIFEGNLENIRNIDLGNEQPPIYEIKLGKRSRSAFFREQSVHFLYQENEFPPKYLDI